MNVVTGATGLASSQVVRALLDRVRALPAVQSAGFGSNLPPRTPLISMAIRLVDRGRDETLRMNVASATPGFLPALGAPVD